MSKQINWIGEEGLVLSLIFRDGGGVHFTCFLNKFPSHWNLTAETPLYIEANKTDFPKYRNGEKILCFIEITREILSYSKVDHLRCVARPMLITNLSDKLRPKPHRNK